MSNEKNISSRIRKEYRSAIRSRRLLRDAFVELMQQKSINKISVSDLVRVADLNRGTFYAHYANPIDVLTEITNEIVDKISEFMVDFKFMDFLQNSKPSFKRVEALLNENIDFYRKILIHTASMEFITNLKKTLVEYISNDKSVPAKIKKQKEFIISLQVFAGGIISVYLDYVQNTINATPEEITDTLCMLVSEISKSVFDKTESKV